MSDKEYEVGYRKPPKSGQFKPGQSGNPKGRPKGTKDLATDLQEELSSNIRVMDGQQELVISKQRALIKALSAKALKGDVKAMGVLLRMIERVIPTGVIDKDEQPISADDQSLIADFLVRNSNTQEKK